MEFLQDNILNLTIFSPLLAAFIIFLLPEDEKNLIRRLALVLSLIPLVLVLIMWLDYNANFRATGGFAFIVQAEWFPAIGASYHIGIDGISLPLFLLTTLLTPVSILASFSIQERVRMYMVLFLVITRRSSL
jgi:NADH-quinone oxidoreductase subunit M